MTNDDNFGPWIDWAGGECPIAPHDYAQVKYRKAGEHEGFALDYQWYHDMADDDIIAYRVRLPADDLLRQAIEALRDMVRAGQKQDWGTRYESEMNAAYAVLAAAAERGL